MLSDLAWLPAPAPDFRARVRALRSEAAAPEGDFMDRATTLATAALDETTRRVTACSRMAVRR